MKVVLFVFSLIRTLCCDKSGIVTQVIAVSSIMYKIN